MLAKVLRILFGAYYLANGLNFFFNFVPLAPPQNEVANVLMSGFIRSGMFELVKIIEVVTGVLLIANLYVPLALICSFPLTVIIAYIDVFILGWELYGWINGGLFFIVHATLLCLYLPYYRSMLVMRANLASAPNR